MVYSRFVLVTNIIRITKPSSNKWTGHLARMGETYGEEKPEEVTTWKA